MSDFYFKISTEKPYFREDEEITILLSRITGAKCFHIKSVNGIFKRKIMVKTTGGKVREFEEILYQKTMNVQENYLRKREKLREMKNKENLTKSNVKEKKNIFCIFKFNTPHEKYRNLPTCEGTLIRCQYFFECDISLKGIFNRARNFTTSRLEVLICQNPKAIRSRRIALKMPNMKKFQNMSQYNQQYSEVLDKRRFSRKETPNKNDESFNMLRHISKKDSKNSKIYRDNSIKLLESDNGAFMFASITHKKFEDNSHLTEKSSLNEIENVWKILPEFFFRIDENPKNKNNPLTLEYKKSTKRELLAKKNFLRNNESNFKLYYKRNRKIDKKIFELKVETGEIFPILKKKEKIVDEVYKGDQVIFDPYKSEGQENRIMAIDPEELMNENFKERCFLYPTPKEDYEDVKLEEEKLARGFSKMLTINGINLNEKVHHNLNKNQLEMLKIALLRSNKKLILNTKNSEIKEIEHGKSLVLSGIQKEEESKGNGKVEKEILKMIEPGEPVETTERSLIENKEIN